LKKGGFRGISSKSPFEKGGFRGISNDTGYLKIPPGPPPFSKGGVNTSPLSKGGVSTSPLSKGEVGESPFFQRGE